MNISQHLILLLATAAWNLTCSGFAQNPPIYETNVPEDPLGYILGAYDGPANINLDMPGATEGRVTGTELAAGASVPVIQLEALTLAMGFGGQWNRFEFADVPLDNTDLYALTIPIDLIYTGLDRWTFWGNVTPGLFSDLRRITPDDYRTLLHGMALYRLMPQLQLGAGVSYDREFGDDKVYPIGGVIWNIGKQWELDALFPSPAVKYSPTRRWVFFVNARPAGNKWNLRITDPSRDGDFKLQSWQVGLGAEVEVVSHVWLHGSTGMDIDRSYTVQDADYKIKSEATETWFARAGILVR